MRSVWARSFVISILSSLQFRTISSAASCGMMPRRACTRASAASMSRYFWVRFSSDQTARIASVLKMSPKIAESMIVAGMIWGFRWMTGWSAPEPCRSGVRTFEDRLHLEQGRAGDHPAVQMDDAGASLGRSEHAPRPVDLAFARNRHAADPQPGREPDGTGEGEIA